MDEKGLPRIPSPLDAEWRKSRRSLGNGECVEVACDMDMILVRDSKDLKGTHLLFTPTEWQSFTVGMKNSLGRSWDALGKMTCRGRLI